VASGSGQGKQEVKVRITKKVVDGLNPESRDVWVWDTELKGFGLRARPTGRKSYVVEYRPGAGGRGVRKQRYTIGQHGSPWTPDAARKKAIEVLGDVAKGGDPAQERLEARRLDDQSLEKFFELYIQSYAKVHQKSWKETERAIRREVLPYLGKKRLAELSKRDVAKVIERIGKRAPVMAHRTFSYVRRFLNWCVEQGHIETNPCLGLKPPPGGKARDRVLSDKELKDVWVALEDLTPLWRQAFKFMIITGQRKNEVLGLEWAELDFEDQLWRLPGRRTKNGHSHEVPLCEMAVAVLKEVPQFAGSRYVFTVSGTKPIAVQSRTKKQIDERVADLRKERGIVDPMPGWTIHDLRRTVTTGMARLGVPPHVADALLNHRGGVVSGVAAVYNRYAYLEERQAAFKKWEQHLRNILK
jgi:integrase